MNINELPLVCSFLITINDLTWQPPSLSNINESLGGACPLIHISCGGVVIDPHEY